MIRLLSAAAAVTAVLAVLTALRILKPGALLDALLLTVLAFDLGMHALAQLEIGVLAAGGDRTGDHR